MADPKSNGKPGKGGLGRLSGSALVGLVLALIIGVAFSFIYPETEITTELGALFALAGLALAWAGRKAIRR